MKRIIIICVFVIMTSTSAMAFNINLDPQGAYMSTKTTNWHLSYGGLLGFSINDDFALVMNALFTTGSYYINTVKMETKHTYYMGGIEYTIPGEWVPWLTKYRLSLRATALSGYSLSEAKSTAKPWNTNPNTLLYLPPDVSATGVPFMIKAGILFDISQHFAVYLDMGYHVIFSNEPRAKSSYNFYPSKFVTGDIQGFIMNVGVRFSFLKKKRLY